jgi:hypothetical protein
MPLNSSTPSTPQPLSTSLNINIMNRVDIEYNTEKPDIQYPEYGRSIQEMLLYAKTIESRPHRQRNVEAIVGLMMQLGPGGNRNIDDHQLRIGRDTAAGCRHPPRGRAP